MSNMRTSAAVSCIACLLCAGSTACSERSPEAEFRKNVREVASWAAASRMVVDRWQARSVPTAYALDELKAAQEDVRQQIASFGDRRDVVAARRDRARAASEQLVALCARLEQAIGRSSGAEAMRICARLGDVERTLRGLTRGEAQ